MPGPHRDERQGDESLNPHGQRPQRGRVSGHQPFRGWQGGRTEEARGPSDSLADEIGTIEPGKRADLLILRANPLIDVAAYDQIELVILAGIPTERSGLSARGARNEAVSGQD